MAYLLLKARGQESRSIIIYFIVLTFNLSPCSSRSVSDCTMDSKYKSSGQPTFSVIEAPPLRYTSLAQNTDLSFSSYLKPKENDTGCTVDDSEISIFDAQKYFSENSDAKDIRRRQQQQQPSNDLLSVPRISSVSSVEGYGRNSRTRSFHSTPTASSEASWNSQSGLLTNPPGSARVSLRNFSSDHNKKRSSIAKKWIFGRKFCCTGKKSVQVKEVTSDSEHGGPVITTESKNNAKANYLQTTTNNLRYEEKPPPSLSQKAMALNPLPLLQETNFPATDVPRQRRASASGRLFGDGAVGFSFPILKSSGQPSRTGIINKKIINPPEDPARDSLEVFQPLHELPVGARLKFNPGSPIKRATNTNHFQPVHEFSSTGSPIARVINTEDDAGSDASSDLFEIESFSTQTTSYPMYRRRDSLDEAPTFNARRFCGRSSLDEPPTPGTECYAPSEASIDWSVTTAEGFDRASVSNFSASASEMAYLRRRIEEEGDGWKRKGNGGLLMMSCRQEKAVSVGPQPVKCPPIFPMHVGGGGPTRTNKPPAGGSQSARFSVAFAA